jgi:teichuronic acid biosynthesis glycosyltransferase TuaC
VKILYVVIAGRDVPLEITNDDTAAHVCPRQLKQGVEKLGIEADYFPIAGTVTRWNYVKGALKFFWMSLRGDLDEYDIIHAHYGFHGVVARCQFRKPLVLSLMGSDVYRKSERMIARVLVKFVRAVIVPGGQMRALIDNYPADVIPYGTDLDIFTPMDHEEMRAKLNLPTGKKLVLFPYNPTRVYHKRPDVIEAAIKQIPEAEMVVAYGKTSKEVAEYMNACDVLAMASMYEGSPGTIREALACNLPIVSVDVADVKDHIVGVEGCYLCEREPNDMAEKLRMAFADNKRLPHGRDKVLHLGLKECAERTIDVYKRVLEKLGKTV